VEISKPPIQWVQGVVSLGLKRLGREADRSRPSSADVKECVELTSTLQYVFMARYLVRHMSNFTLSIYGVVHMIVHMKYFVYSSQSLALTSHPGTLLITKIVTIRLTPPCTVPVVDISHFRN
jgi:hypothetical protein